MTKDPQCCDAAAADECRCSCHDMKPAVCSMCRRERTSKDALGYSATQVIFGTELGWYSGDDGEICADCMAKTLNRQRYGQ